MCQKLKDKKLWVGGGNLQIFKGKLCNLKLTKKTQLPQSLIPLSQNLNQQSLQNQSRISQSRRFPLLQSVETKLSQSCSKSYLNLNLYHLF